MIENPKPLKMAEIIENIYPELCAVGLENCYSCGNLCGENDDYCHEKERTLTEGELKKGCESWDTIAMCPPGYLWDS